MRCTNCNISNCISCRFQDCVYSHRWKNGCNIHWFKEDITLCWWIVLGHLRHLGIFIQQEHVRQSIIHHVDHQHNFKVIVTGVSKLQYTISLFGHDRACWYAQNSNRGGGGSGVWGQSTVQGTWCDCNCESSQAHGL